MADVDSSFGDVWTQFGYVDTSLYNLGVKDTYIDTSLNDIWSELDDLDTSLISLTDVSIVDVSSNNTLKYNGIFEKWKNEPDFWDVSNNDVILYDPSHNLELSSIELLTDGGILELTDMPIVSASDGVEQSYSMKLGGANMLKIYGEADGAGSTSETAIIMDASYFILGSIGIDGSWRFWIDPSGNLSFEKRVSGTWINKGTFE